MSYWNNHNHNHHHHHSDNASSSIALISTLDNTSHPALVTPWSLIHIFSGIMAYILLSTFTSWNNFEKGLAWLNLGTFYEIKDMYKTYVSKEHNYNTFANSMGDIVFNMIGFFIGMSMFKEISQHAKIVTGLAYVAFYIYMVKCFPETG